MNEKQLNTILHYEKLCNFSADRYIYFNFKSKSVGSCIFIVIYLLYIYSFLYRRILYKIIFLYYTMVAFMRHV